jgi:hypothetical protein
MKTSTKLIFLLLLLFVAINTLAQNEIKRKTMQTFTSVNSYGFKNDGIKLVGESVPGAEVIIKLDSGGKSIANVITGEKGEFFFEASEIPNFPNQGVLILSITPSKEFCANKKKPLKTEIIKVKFISSKDKYFSFILFWLPDDVSLQAENKGAFAVSGKNST